MENRQKELDLQQDLKTIVECEIDWNSQDANEDDCDDDNKVEDKFQHLELRSQRDLHTPIYIHNLDHDNQNQNLEEQPVPDNLFGSRTYTSPASFDSSSGNSDPFRNEQPNGMRHPGTKQKSIASKLMSEQNSEKFSMLRNVIENIEDPEKRKILLNFLDQSTLKTEYVTIKESSNSGEQAKDDEKYAKVSKRRRKSPLSQIGKARLPRKTTKINAHSQERKRFSFVHPRVKTVSQLDQQVQNFVIERKIAVDTEVESNPGGAWYTEESKEMPLEFILNKINHGKNPFVVKSRGQSGYSASRDDQTNPGDKEIEYDHYHFGLDPLWDLEAKPKGKNKDIIILPPNFEDAKKGNTDENVKLNIIQTWKKYIKSSIIVGLLIALVIALTRGIQLEIMHKSDNNHISSLNRQINELYKSNHEWEQKYNEWAYGVDSTFHAETSNAESNSIDQASYLKESP